MKKIGFIGAYDKTDLLLNIAKILSVMNLKVILVDSSVNQKAKYIVPTISPTISYITSFEEIDVAVGFKDEEQIKKYVAKKELPYDIMLVDCDMPQRIDSFNLENADKNYFVTSFDMYSLRRGMEIFDELNNEINLTKLIISEPSNTGDEYLNYISSEKKIKWSEAPIYISMDSSDMDIIIENQRIEKIKFKKLSTLYKDSISFLVQHLLDQNSDVDVRKAMKTLERGVI